MFYSFLKIAGGIFSLFFFRIPVKGVENIPRRGAVILAANHRSYLDPPVLALKVPRRVAFVSKTTLYRNLFARLILQNLGVIPLRQYSGAVGMVGAMRCLKKKRALAIFPEGTRNFTGQPFLRANPGVGLLAEGTGAPVIPVYLEGTDKSIPYGARMFRPGRIRIIFGKPLFFTGGGRQEFADKVMAAIVDLSKQDKW